jgi:hypothetical protein
MYDMMKSFFLSLFFAVATSSLIAQPYTFVAYNVENLFDLDEIAVYDDYKPTNEDGEPHYTPKHVLTKLLNITTIMKNYSNGAGPDVIAFAEIESDFSPSHRNADEAAFLSKWASLTIEEMLTTQLTEEIMDIPSELLLLKAFNDKGLTGYSMSVGYPELVNERPESAIKNVIFSKLPILKEKTKRHPITQARPILETWIDVNGNPLIVFANHWKSGASSKDMEAIRVDNAVVLKKRLDELRKENILVDFLLAGDFNTVYNQHLVMKGVNSFSFRTILKTTGNEERVAQAKTDSLYNLWYELSYDKRGSEAYRGELGTLMNILLPSGMYDKSGVYYVDQSFSVDQIPGVNVLSYAQVPIRWDASNNGSGYSDHLPISIQFTSEPNATGPITLKAKPGKEAKEDAERVKVAFRELNSSDYIKLSDINVKELQTEKYYNKLFYCELQLDDENEVELGGKEYKVYAASRDIKKKLDEARQKNKGLVKFYGRNILYKETWELYIDTEEHILD